MTARCLGTERSVEIDGEWVATGGHRPFYVSSGRWNVSLETQYPALRQTKAPARGCPPLAEIAEVVESSPTRQVMLYTLRWPCEEEEGYTAYVGDVEDGDPPRLLGSSEWTSVRGMDEPNEISMSVRRSPFSKNVELRVASKSDSFQSPNTGSGGTTFSSAVWAVRSSGAYGPKLELPDTHSGRAGWCFEESTIQELFLIDLQRDGVPELVVRTTTHGREDTLLPSGEPGCVDSAPKVEWKGYSLNVGTLRWSALPLPRGLSEQTLERARPLDLP